MSGINTKLIWKNKEINLGKKQKVLINQLAGINHDLDYTQTIEKIDMWDNDPQAPDIITDVSLTAPGCGCPTWMVHSLMVSGLSTLKLIHTRGNAIW